MGQTTASDAEGGGEERVRIETGKMTTEIRKEDNLVKIDSGIGLIRKESKLWCKKKTNSL